MRIFLKPLAEAIKDASKTSQLIIATHAPLLLNSFEIDDVVIFEKNVNNETEVYIKSPDEFEEDILVGQAWLQGRIGAKRW